MPINEISLKHWIQNFYGYGSWNAKFWFIGYEESGGEVPEEVSEKIEYFYKEHPPTTDSKLCDIRKLYRQTGIYWDGPKSSSFANRYEYRFGPNAIQHGIWKNLIAFVHGIQNLNVPDLLEYQKHHLASPELCNEALIQLYPLPSPHNHAWYYSWLDLPGIGFLKTRELYEHHVYANRIDTITRNIKTFKPNLVLMYGMQNINLLKQSIQQVLPDTKFRMVKATKLKIPQHHSAQINGTTLLLTTQIPALRHNRVETGFDWYEFGKTIASETK